jgi:hypothetical protein
MAAARQEQVVFDFIAGLYTDWALRTATGHLGMRGGYVTICHDV